MTEQPKSPYAIKSLLPEPERRFLKIRDEFMRITNRRVAEACVLEMVHFETIRKLKKLSPERKAAEFNLLHKGTDPVKDSELWVKLPSKRVLERLCGFASSERTVERAVKNLSEAGLIFVPDTPKRSGSFRRVLLNPPAIGRALNEAGFTNDEWNEGTEAIKGTTSILSLPAASYHALYPTLVEAVAIATQESEDSPARMSLVLLHALWLADENVGNERSPAVQYSRNSLGPQMRFGNENSWWALLKMLGSKNLLTRRPKLEKGRARVYEPNLEIIRIYIAEAVKRRDEADSEDPTIHPVTSDNSPHSIRQSTPEEPTENPDTSDNLPPDGHIPELSPELEKTLRESASTSSVEPLALRMPRGSLPRISSTESVFKGANLIRATQLPADLLGIDLPQLGLREQIVHECVALDTEPIVLSGGYGTGKTVLAAAIMWALMERAERKDTKPGAWIDLELIAPDLRRLPFNSDGYRAAVDALMNVTTKGPIVLDGLEEADSKNLAGVMKDALSKHMNSRGQLIITTHLAPNDFHLAFGQKMGERLREDARIIDCSKAVWVSEPAPSLRVVGEK